jgi:hypothetical protein
LGILAQSVEYLFGGVARSGAGHHGPLLSGSIQ